MTATVHSIEHARLRRSMRRVSHNLQDLVKCKPGPHAQRQRRQVKDRCSECACELSAKRYVGVVKRGASTKLYCAACWHERDIEPDVLLELGIATDVIECAACWKNIQIGENTVTDHNANEVRCVRCFEEGPP